MEKTRHIDSLSKLDPTDPFVVVEEDSRYPSQLVVQSIEQEELNERYSQFLSRFSVLIETGMWHEFNQKLEEDGLIVYIMPSARTVINQYLEWSKPLKVKNYKIVLKDGSEGELYPYQQYGLRKATSSTGGFFFFNWGTGTGKGTAASAGSQELFNLDLIDVVFVFSMRKMKTNLTREFNRTTQLKAVNIEGSPYQIDGKKFSAKQDRARKFEAQDAQVYVMNYEKANFDFDILKKRIKGKRVLFVLDEVQKILTFTNGRPNQAGDGLRQLIRSVKKPSVWAMSATVVGHDPERFWRLFDLPQGKNELGLMSEFRKLYSDGSTTVESRWGSTNIIHWNHESLEEVRHRIGPWSHAVRKTDPGVREFFKDIEFRTVAIELSPEDRELYNRIETWGKNDPDNWGQYYRVLRYLCGTAESLKYSQSELAQIIAEAYPNLTSDTSATMAQLIEDVEMIRDQGDKVVVFCSFTNMGLFRVSEQLTKLGIRHVNHYGTGMNDKEAQKAQDDFKSDPEITVFLSSDAGAMGLNFQEARFVIHFDISYSYDITRQRSDRIDRADSYLEGLTVIAYYCVDTVQERIWKINNERRMMAQSIQGTEESLSRRKAVVPDQVPEEDNLRYLLFGSKE